MKKQIIILAIGLVVNISIHAQISKANSALSQIDNHFFIENKGQWPDDVLFLTRIRGLDAWITRNGILYDFNKLEEIPGSTKIEEALPDKFEQKDFTRIGHKVWSKLLKNNSSVITEGKEKQAGYYNYLIGNDPGKHASNVGLYKEVLVKNVYNGIDMRYYFDKGNIRYDYIVHPGADPSQINFVMEGTDKTYLNPKGDLVFFTRFGEVALAQLLTYQQIKTNKVNSYFVKTENGWSITVGRYNNKQTLIIDPLIYSTYIGGSSYDYGTSIAINALGNAYITGTTVSVNFDSTSGAYQTSFGGSSDAFVSKLNTAGTALIYSTYLGGNNSDAGLSITLDASGNAYIAGISSSSNFNTTSGAYQTSFAGGFSDIIVTKLNTTGTALVYSTFLGGSDEDRGYSIVIDAKGNSYVTGYTSSYNYDVTTGAYKTNHQGGTVDVFVTKLNSTGKSLVYSTYLGGSQSDFGRSIAIDSSGNAYVTGNTSSANYDVTSGAYRTSIVSGDAFVTKLNANGTALVYSTFLGGNNNDDRGYSIALDASGNAYVTGFTASTDLDITSGAYQTAYGGGTYDAFVSKLNATGTALVYSTYLGGNGWDEGFSIAIDTSGNAYITGQTKSTNYDTTSGAYQTVHEGAYDAFVTKLNATGTALTYSTFLGGSNDDGGYCIAVNNSGSIFIAGNTGSANYDTTSGVYQSGYAGVGDVFVTRICLVAYATINRSSSTGTDSQSVCINNAITSIKYATKDASGATISGLPAGVTGSFAADTVTISGTPVASGVFSYTIILTGGCGTGVAHGSITVNPAKTMSLSSTSGTDSQSVCINKSITQIRYTTKYGTGATFTGLPNGVTGSFSANSVIIKGTPVTSGIFNYIITLTGGCGTVTAKGSITVKENTINLSSSSGTDSQSLCIKTAITNITYASTGASGANVTGLPAGVTGSFASNIVSISGTPTASGIYIYIVTLTGGCGTITAKGSITVNPDNTISISSASGTDSQSVCINTAISDITYASTNANGATVTGLPAGVSDSFAANVLTISGTPTKSGTFNYTVTLNGGCGTVTTKGSITVKPNNTISISSASGTDSQSVCINTAISDITYASTDASNATVTDLPAGVSASFVTNVVTISGTPAVSGTFPYTITLTGGCGTTIAKGIIFVNPDNTITLSSASGTDSQSLNINIAIAPIMYSTQYATGATVDGLPAGVTDSFSANEVTISGTPTAKGTFPYTLTLTGGCGTITAKGSIIVRSLGIADQVKNQTLQVFPNPAHTEVSIQAAFTASFQIEIIDALGRISQAVYSLDKDAIKIQVSSLENGIYCIRIIDSGQVFQSKIVVQH